MSAPAETKKERLRKLNAMLRDDTVDVLLKQRDLLLDRVNHCIELLPDGSVLAKMVLQQAAADIWDIDADPRV